MDALAKLPSIRSLNNNIPMTTTTVTTATTVVVAAPILAYWYRSYRAFVSLGPGGLPASLKGWFMQCLMRPFARYDIRVPAPWSDESLSLSTWIGGERGLWWSGGGKKYDGDEARISYIILPSSSSSSSSRRIPPRSGGTAGRPRTTEVVVPQRQLSQTVHESLKSEAEQRILDRMDRFLLRLADMNPTMFEIRTSVLERHGNGVFVRKGFEVGGAVEGAKEKKTAKEEEGTMTVDERMGNGGAREFFHVHHGDGGSSHIILSLTDAATAISARWAERHMMSGTFLLPWGYVMVYTPRDEGELAVWRELVLASARYVVGDAEGKMVVAPEV